MKLSSNSHLLFVIFISCHFSLICSDIKQLGLEGDINTQYNKRYTPFNTLSCFNPPYTFATKGFSFSLIDQSSNQEDIYQSIDEYTHKIRKSIANDKVWNNQKLMYYYKALYAQISQNKEIQNALLNSDKNRGLVYNHQNQKGLDSYYGINNNKGANYIGQIIMKIRTDLLYPQVKDSLFQKIKKYHRKKPKEQKGWNSLTSSIKFYNRTAKYYEFTNFFDEAPLLIEGHIYKTSEHYYQTQKFTCTPAIQKDIIKVSSAKEAFIIAQNNKAKKDSNWNNKSLSSMIKAVWIKFNQHENLQQLLLETGNTILIEDAGQNDSFYGNGPDGQGDNYLGCILMAVREQLSNSSPTYKQTSSKHLTPSPPVKTSSSVHSTLQSYPLAQPTTPSLTWYQHIYQFFVWLFTW